MANSGGRSVSVFLLCVLLTVSCSVKEDRTDCPCSLFVELESLPPSAKAQLSFSSEGFYDSRTALQDTSLMVQVPKTDVLVLAISGASPGDDGRVRIPLGFECPPLHLFAGEVDARGERAELTARLHKHYCLLELEFSGPPGWGEPYWTEIRGEVNGIEMDGSPSEGEFSCRLDSGFSCRLPRQSPDRLLWLDIAMPDRVVRTFNLARFMLDAGYDWTAPDLEDMTLHIDLSVSEISFRTDNWSTVIPIAFEI